MKRVFEIPDEEFDRARALLRWVGARQHLSDGEVVSVFAPENPSDCGFKCRVMSVSMVLEAS